MANHATTTMIIPVRCFTCGTVIAGKWCAYERECDAQDKGPAASASTHRQTEEHGAGASNASMQYRGDNGVDRGAIMDRLGIKRICCRRHFLGNVDLMDMM